MEEGDLGHLPISVEPASSDAAERIRRRIANAPAEHMPMIEKVVDDLLDNLKRVA
jgi:hypothetical protein